MTEIWEGEEDAITMNFETQNLKILKTWNLKTKILHYEILLENPIRYSGTSCVVHNAFIYLYEVI